MGSLRSTLWFGRSDELGLQHRAVLRSLGWSPEFFSGKPIIGIANSWSELNPCNSGLRAVADAVKRGVIAAGGVPLEFNTISLGEDLMKPSAMMYRNLMAMEIEEVLRAYPLDGVVLLSGCDKTTPAQLMAVASANLPAIQVCAGPRSSVKLAGKEIVAGVSLWKSGDEYRSGKMNGCDWQSFEEAYGAGVPGTCSSMGSASTMAVVSEALGMMLPGTSAIPSQDARRMIAAERSGARAVALVQQGITPSQIMTLPAFENALRAYLSAGGSTNAIIHLIAIARRLRVPLALADFDRIARDTPLLLNMQPAGEYLMADFDSAGGLPALFHQLREKISLTAATANGKPWGEVIRDGGTNPVLCSTSNPLRESCGLAVLRGSLSPRGAILKTATACARLCQHRGQALVFKNYDDLRNRIDSDDLKVTPDSVLVLQNAGAVGVQGMPEWGNIPIPRRLLHQGVTDMVRSSDSRMSGTAHGTVILHMSPEAAIGGDLALVRDGDWIELDLAGRRLDLMISDAERMVRKASWKAPVSPHLRGYPRFYAKCVLQPDEGCDFDFMNPDSDEALHWVTPTIGRS